MVKDGNYVVWFRTPRGQGTGHVHLSEGKISGGDAFITYCGSYEAMTCGVTNTGVPALGEMPPLRSGLFRYLISSLRDADQF